MNDTGPEVPDVHDAVLEVHDTVPAPVAPDYPLDDELRLNEVQAIGSHNSYHVEPELPFDDSHYYTHLPLEEQLASQGVRQFELDFHYREDVGFQIFHLPAIDEVTTCLLFVDCLGAIKGWSDAHPGHLPVMIWLEPKSDADFLDATLLDLFGRWDELEAEILSVWPRDRILAPDDVRGDHATLRDAVTTDGWPTLGEVRDKLIFALLDGGEHRDDYLAWSPDLVGRLLFPDTESAEDPNAGMFKINNAVTDAAKVSELAAAGFMITSNVDSPTDSDEDNAAKLAASLASGPHFVSSDFPGAPGPGGGYSAQIPGGQPVGCNPVSASAASRSPALSAAGQPSGANASEPRCSHPSAEPPWPMKPPRAMHSNIQSGNSNISGTVMAKAAPDTASTRSTAKAR